MCVCVCLCVFVCLYVTECVCLCMEARKCFGVSVYVHMHMRVRMLVGASVYASSCMSGVACVCAWCNARFSILTCACALTSMSVCVHPFSPMRFHTCPLFRIASVFLHDARQHPPMVISHGYIPQVSF